MSALNREFDEIEEASMATRFDSLAIAAGCYDAVGARDATRSSWIAMIFWRVIAAYRARQSAKVERIIRSGLSSTE